MTQTEKWALNGDWLSLPEPVVGDPACSPPDRLNAALALLLQSHHYAHDLGVDVWDFAVELSNLVQLRLSRNDLRWLVAKGLVKHAEEITAEHDKTRRFAPCSPWAVPSRACFVLSEEGLAAARRMVRSERPSLLETSPALFQPYHPCFPELPRQPSRALLPRWDGQRRELRVENEIIKVFRVPAPNQEIILATFEEEHWPPRIDDPLPVKSRFIPKRRLHDAITALNRHHRQPLIRFSADGLGKGVRWEPLNPPYNGAGDETFS